MKKTLQIITLLAVSLFAVSAMADPLTLKISDGTNIVTVSSLTNTVTYSGMVGPTFNVSFSAGISNAPGSPNGGQISITNNTVQNVGSATGTLTFTLTGLNFSAPGSTGDVVTLSSSGAYDWSAGIQLGSSATFQGFADPSNGGGLLNGTPPCTVSGPGTAGACPATTSLFTRGSTDYSLSEVTKITLVKGDQINTSSSVSTVPEPASLALLGSGLLMGGGFLRRKLTR